MYKKIIYLIFFLFIIVSCKKSFRYENIIFTKKVERRHPISFDSMFMSVEENYGVYEYTDDKINVSQENYNGNFYIKHDKTYLNSDKLQITIDANKLGFIPIYIENISEFPIELKLNEEGLAIQEALDKNGLWRPIDYSSCFFMEGSFHTRLDKNQFIVKTLRKYRGNYKTKIRLRLTINNRIYLTESFEGFINYGQFFIPKRKSNSRFNKLDKRIIECDFKGSLPIEYNEFISAKL